MFWLKRVSRVCFSGLYLEIICSLSFETSIFSVFALTLKTEHCLLCPPFPFDGSSSCPQRLSLDCEPSPLRSLCLGEPSVWGRGQLRRVGDAYSRCCVAAFL